MQKQIVSMLSYVTTIKIGSEVVAAIVTGETPKMRQAAASLVEIFRAMGVKDPKQFLVDNLAELIREIWRYNGTINISDR